MNAILIVTENDGGDSLSLPGEWSCESVNYNDTDSVTTYHFESLDKSEIKFINRVLDDASGVINYHWRIPRKGGTSPDTSLHLGEQRKVWLREQGGIQPTIHRLVDAAMDK